jgi:hypothetical protein
MKNAVTFLDALLAATLIAGDFHQDDQTPPAAILCLDEERQ